MSESRDKMSRRGFIKAAGCVGLGSVLAHLPTVGAGHAASSSRTDGPETVPVRPFGKTGDSVSILSLGGVLKDSDVLLFRKAFEMGVTYWDTADTYGWGKNEKAIGKYLAKFPDDRKEIFLVTKAASLNPEKLSKKLHTSLQRMNTSYVDMYFIHHVDDVQKELTPEVKAWAEKAKREGKIRFFGFSAHKNMENSMFAAAKLGWIDGIMMSYNYRLMGKETMKRAVDACVEAGIGLTAMKTQAAFSANLYASIGSETDQALQLTENLMKIGYTAEQAKLKVVWDNPNISSICSAMPNMAILQANVAAALNRTQLSVGDKQRLQRFAQSTAPGYCAGCAAICESAVETEVPIGDIMRYAMYCNSYGDRSHAADWYSALPEDSKKVNSMADYRKAELRCPQGIQIGKVIREVFENLAETPTV